MKARALLLVVALTGALLGQDIPANMKQYFVAFLVKADKAEQALPKVEQDGLMRKHLAYIRSQVEAGKFLVCGPLLDGGRIGGLAIVDVPTIEEARRIADGDPMVQSGRMAMEIHPAMLPDVSSVKIDYGAH